MNGSQNSEPIGVVEERALGGNEAFHAKVWHYSCAKCGQRMRFVRGVVKLFECPRCHADYEADSWGRVFSARSANTIAERADEILTQAKPGRSVEKESGLISGLFSRAARGASGAIERVHGERLQAGFQKSRQQIARMNDELARTVFLKLVQRISALEIERQNWSDEGSLKMGQTLQHEAAKCADFNQVESQSLWLTGAWLESSVRNSAEAREVFEAIDQVYRELK
jgi:hypothetical protein